MAISSCPLVQMTMEQCSHFHFMSGTPAYQTLQKHVDQIICTFLFLQYGNPLTTVRTPKQEFYVCLDSELQHWQRTLEAGYRLSSGQQAQKIRALFMRALATIPFSSNVVVTGFHLPFDPSNRLFPDLNAAASRLPHYILKEAEESFSPPDTVPTSPCLRDVQSPLV